MKNKSLHPDQNAAHGLQSSELFDEWLVMMAMSGDRRAAEKLHQRWNLRLTRAAKRYGVDDEAVRDLVQESWLAIFKGLAGLRDPKRFRAYAFSVLHRRGADHLRKVMQERGRLHDDGNQEEQSARDNIGERAAIKQAFARLPPDLRMAAHLHFVEGLTLREIAQVQDIPDGTAKSRIFHARRKLKQALGTSS